MTTAPARTMSARSKPYHDYNTKTRPCLRCGIDAPPNGFSKGICMDCRPYGPVIEISHTSTTRRQVIERPQPGPNCGTTAGRVRHQRRGEPPCRPCLDAHLAKQRENRRKKTAA